MKHALVLILLAMLIVVPALAADTYRFYFNQTNLDGYMYNANSASPNTYETMRNYATGASDKVGGLVYIKTESSTASPNFKYVMTGVYSADTSILPDSDTIESAELCVYYNYKNNALGSVAYGVTGWFPSTNGTIAAGDYDSRLGGPRYATDKAYADIGAGYNCWALNSAGINNISKTGWSNLAISDAWNIDGTFGGTYATSSVTEFRAVSGNASSNQPYLNVTTGGAPEVFPPTAPTNLQNSTPTCDAVNIQWISGDNSTGVRPYLNDTLQTNITVNYLNLTGLPAGVSHTLSLQSYNSSGFINTTWANLTFTTAASCGPIFTPYYTRFAFGDSVTSVSGSNNYYLYYYTTWYHSGDTVSHNIDGNSKTSTWGRNVVNNAAYHNGSSVYVMFGLNDYGNSTALEVAGNMDAICDAVEVNGSTCNLLLPTIMANDTIAGGKSTFEVQYENITDEQNYYTSIGRTYIKTYDILDSMPCNGVPNPINASMLSDGVHPTATAQGFIAEYLNNSDVYCARWPAGVAPVAAFSASNTTMCAGNVTRFTDESTNTPTSWYWEFGDGNTSTTQSPLVQYDVIGLKTVNMKATNAYGSDWENKTGYINVTTCVTPTPTPTPTPTTATPTPTPTTPPTYSNLWCGVQDLYFQDIPSGIDGFRDLHNYASGNALVDENVTITNTDGVVFIDSYISPPGALTNVKLLEGLRNYNIYGYVSSVAQPSYFTFNVSRYDTSTNTEVFFYNISSVAISSVTPTLDKTYYTSQKNVSFTSTERILIRIGAYTTRNTATTIHFLNQGTTPTYVQSGYFSCPVVGGAASNTDYGFAICALAAVIFGMLGALVLIRRKQ